VEGDLVNLLVQRGIAIADTTTRLKGKQPGGGNYEFDIIAHNGEEVVVVEVKTTLRPDDVKNFLDKLDHLKAWIPRYAQNRIYGAIAWLTADASAEAMVIKRGLFSIRATGDSASIQNDSAFTPQSPQSLFFKGRAQQDPLPSAKPGGGLIGHSPGGHRALGLRVRPISPLNAAFSSNPEVGVAPPAPSPAGAPPAPSPADAPPAPSPADAPRWGGV